MTTDRSAVSPTPGVRRRALWSLVAQGLGSANGLVTAIVAARVMSPADFGTFSALMVVALMFVGLTGAFLAQPLLLTRAVGDDLAAQARSTLFTALLVGSIFGVLLLAVSPAFGPAQAGLSVLAISLPLLMTADAFRYVATVLGHARKAALFDALRLVVFLGLYVAFYAGERQDATSLAILWCGCAAFIGALGVAVGAHLTRRTTANLRPFFRPQFLGYQFGLEFFIGTFGSTVPTLSLGWFVSVEAIGHLRGVSTLFGPILVVATSAILVISPYLVVRTPPQRTKLLLGMAAVFNVATLAWMAVLLMIPDAWGRELLGDVWAGSRELVVPIALQMVGIGILTTAQTGIRVARPRYSFMMNVLTVVWAFICFSVGVALGGLTGAVWGFTVGAAGAALIAVGIYVKVKDSAPAPDRADAEGAADA